MIDMKHFKGAFLVYSFPLQQLQQTPTFLALYFSKKQNEIIRYSKFHLQISFSKPYKPNSVLLQMLLLFIHKIF